MADAGDLERVRLALALAQEILGEFTPGQVEHRDKAGAGPVTEADLRVDRALREMLPQDGEGWLSEETADDPVRLERARVWIVDPIDGTKEFVAGVPEWCVSIALVEDGRAVVGGICNPVRGETVLGSLSAGVTYNGTPCRVLEADRLEGCQVLSSRSETVRGEWERYRQAGFVLRPTGSVAYKLGLVAAGQAHATWTTVPKSEWDVAAGVALVEAAGGRACTPDGQPLRFNRRETRLPGIIAAAPGLIESIRELEKRS